MLTDQTTNSGLLHRAFEAPFCITINDSLSAHRDCLAYHLERQLALHSRVSKAKGNAGRRRFDQIEISITLDVPNRPSSWQSL